MQPEYRGAYWGCHRNRAQKSGTNTKVIVRPALKIDNRLVTHNRRVENFDAERAQLLGQLEDGVGGQRGSWAAMTGKQEVHGIFVYI